MRPTPVLFLLSVGTVVVYILMSGFGSNSWVRKGSPAPSFTVKTLEGEEVSLEDLKGRVVFLNFWRTDCGPCVAEMQDLELLAEKFRGRKFQMMPVSLDIEAEDVTRFYYARDLNMPAFFDPHQKVADKYNISGTPETFVIDREGNVAKIFIGQRNWTSPEMVEMLEEMIAN
jgi:cytochrome c biogenesis protein CcmG, thiol:disulfide interchange protein DsbE